LCLKHGVWTTRYSDIAGQDHNWRGRGFHADRSFAFIAGSERHEFCVAVGSVRCAGSDSDTAADDGGAHSDTFFNSHHIIATTHEQAAMVAPRPHAALCLTPLLNEPKWRNW